MKLNQVTLPARDVAASVNFYKTMGFDLIVESSGYARFQSTVGDTTFSVDHTEELKEQSKTVVYFECSSLDDKVAELKARGLVFVQDPTDEPWLWREARLLDPSGNTICLYFSGSNRLHAPP